MVSVRDILGLYYACVTIPSCKPLLKPNQAQGGAGVCPSTRSHCERQEWKYLLDLEIVEKRFPTDSV